MPLRKMRHVFVAVLLVALMLGQVTWALAGTTGGLGGTITDADAGNAPIANASVSVVSASQSATTTTDASGHYVFLSLAPDTYTVSVVKNGYEPTSQAGISVFADQHVSVDIPVHKSLKTIARVTSRSSNDLVKSGTTSDVYAVNAATAEKVVALGGGGNLNSAYSALASQPGVTLGYGGIGWGQTVFIHGASYSQVGYEYDGVPVNRAFDNYNANSLSNLGQQELQVATGGANASSVSSTAGGYINQVIRTGTYPGFGGFDLGVGAPTFYHQLKAEAGGAAPNRLFSYYAGLLGSNQNFRQIDQYGGGAFQDGILPFVNGGSTAFGQANIGVGGVVPYCVTPGVSGVTGIPDQGCVSAPFWQSLGATADYNDRETVLNFHFGIPHKHDGGRDDIQLLYDGSYQHQDYFGSIQDYGGYAYLSNQVFGDPSGDVTGRGYLPYLDTVTFKPSTAFGQVVAQGTTPGTSNYFFPNTGLNRVAKAPIPTTLRPGQNNDAGIIKAQYQHNIGSSAYLRAYGYSFYSDWLNSDPVAGELAYGLGNYQVFPTSPDYELITHTRGGELQYANQFNSKNLVTATFNYVTANVSRYNNATYRVSGNFGYLPTDPANPAVQQNITTGRAVSVATNFVLVDAAGNPIMDGKHCINFRTGALASCFLRGTQGTFLDPTRATYCSTHSCAAVTSGAGKWVVTNTGPAGTLNQVTPKFTSFSLTDEYRPTDKLLLNFGARFDRFEYDLQSTNTPADSFWFGAAQQSFCYDPAAGNSPVNLPQTAPPQPGGTPMFVGFNCPNSPITGTQTRHPDGTGGNLLFTNASDTTYSVTKFQPRLSGTYTLNPDTVLRFSAGSYVNPSNTASIQYIDASPSRMAFFDYNAFFGIGFNTPEHPVKPTTSTNVDFSLEKRIHGTDMSYKISPYYRYVKDQTQDTFIGPGFVSAIPQGNETAYGLELQISKGDPQKNGFSGQLSYTYNHATMKFNPIGNTGLNQIDSVNSAVALYNGLTKAGSGTSYTQSNGHKVTLGTAAPCYYQNQGFGAGLPTITVVDPVTGATTPLGPADCGSALSATALGVGAVINPYYNMPTQSYYDPHGSYPLYQTFPNLYDGPVDINETILWPNVFAGWLNYKHNKLAITPNFQLIDGYSGGSNGGGAYGSPLTTLGVDPRSCAGLQPNAAGTASVPSGNQGNAFAGAGGTAPAGTAGLPDYLACGGSAGPNGYLYIPNPYTGSFDNFGQYKNPWLLNVNAQIRYEISPRMTANLILNNIYNHCYGGTKTPWSSAEPPGKTVCGYFANGIFAGGLNQTPGTGFFYGNSPTDRTANPAAFSKNIFYPYSGATSFLPFQAYLQLNIKL